MKRPRSKAPPLSVPRLDSLLHRLQKAPGAEEESHLDQLMIFLDDPPPGVTDRWKEGAKMCSDWGVPCTGASVWRLYRSYVLEWRLSLTQKDGDDDDSAEALEKRTERLVALRTLEVLANPQSPPACLVAVARIAVRKQALELARQKHEDSRTDTVPLALKTLSQRRNLTREAVFALEKLKLALRETDSALAPPKPAFPAFPFGPFA